MNAPLDSHLVSSVCYESLSQIVRDTGVGDGEKMEVRSTPSWAAFDIFMTLHPDNEYIIHAVLFNNSLSCFRPKGLHLPLALIGCVIGFVG